MTSIAKTAAAGAAAAFSLALAAPACAANLVFDVTLNLSQSGGETCDAALNCAATSFTPLTTSFQVGWADSPVPGSESFLSGVQFIQRVFADGNSALSLAPDTGLTVLGGYDPSKTDQSSNQLLKYLVTDSRIDGPLLGGDSIMSFGSGTDVSNDLGGGQIGFGSYSVGIYGDCGCIPQNLGPLDSRGVLDLADYIHTFSFTEQAAFGSYDDVTGTGPFTFYTLSGTATFDRADSTVPEPAAWALMIAGFGLAGAALRGRLRRPA